MAEGSGLAQFLRTTLGLQGVVFLVTYTVDRIDLRCYIITAILILPPPKGIDSRSC